MENVTKPIKTRKVQMTLPDSVYDFYAKLAEEKVITLPYYLRTVLTELKADFEKKH